MLEEDSSRPSSTAAVTKDADTSTEDEQAAGKTSEEAITTPHQAAYEIFGDASYGTANLVETIEGVGAKAHVKVQAPAAPEGRFSKDAFEVNLDAGTVSCPGGLLVQIRKASDGGGLAGFGVRCATCGLRPQCTGNKEGRTIRIHPKESTLQRKRAEQKSPEWKTRYHQTRPKVERKLAHLMFRRHGGRRARMRGSLRIRHDFALLGAAQNLRRMATLGLRHNDGAWMD